ncbi:integrase arm-type DNA-binding domain-containing protein [Halomonas qinghailakensis]|uniref:Integrase arm-type DNA-binding domain-containing protein n=1 Tax=Halomonas qinghailakensis TaxID=2937790 RepID=A0AA46TUG1_9GAMM|nr:site-specific integrase [Halomonas sp. ZZQ-149]UYO75752.1 integrase arm-type DNA-binding domain-containing protein [Halomonas sp. ZZQ-149]
MPKVAKELSAAEVRRIDRPGFHPVGGVPGLLLQVSPGGGRSWVLRVMVGQRRRGFGLGSFPAVPLGDARNKARELRDKLAQGIDPVAERQAARAAHIAAQAKRLTFREAAEQYHATKEKEFRNAKHRKDWIGSLKRYAFIHIGEVPVGDVELPHVLKALEPIWETKTETATRVRQRIEGVLAWAAVRGYRSGDNPARWQGNLDAVLAKPAKVGKGKRHFPALPWQRVPEFLQDLRTREGMGARALEFAILTAARSGEIRGATWGEIDLSAKVWTIPAERMKAGKPHRIPLSPAAVTLLEALPRMQGQPLVFPAVRGGKISDVTILATVKRMNATKEKEGGEQYTDPIDGRPVVPHGFRSAFKDWARNRSSYPDEVSELALAHVNSDATRAAYARDELLPQRTKLMTAWADYCAEPAKAGASVTAIRREA